MAAEGNYRDQSISQRLDIMGRPAEKRFARWAENRGISLFAYGIEGTKFAYAPGLDYRIKTTPDYIAVLPQAPAGHRHAFFEVKGCGHDGILKIKLSAAAGMRFWGQIHPMYIFVWHKTTNRVAHHSLSEVESWLDPNRTGQFSDSNRYYEVPTDLLTWYPAPQV
jgi:hypothetical protein